MSRSPSRYASKMRVLQLENALASAAVLGSRTSPPTSSGGGSSGTGDMEKSVYDPTNAAADIFAYADQTESDANTYTDSAITGLASVYAALGVIKGVQFYTNNDTYTPTAGTTSFLVIGCGGGGGGGGVGSIAAPANTRRGGGHGGAGELRVAVFSVDVESYTITVGGVGSAGSAGNNDGGAGGDVSINDGTTDIFVCKGGEAGGGSSGSTVGSSGSPGSGGTGGVSLAPLLISGAAIPNFSGTSGGGFNTLFGAPTSPVTNATSDSTGSLILASSSSGFSGLGRGSGGGGGWHWNGSTATEAGAAGTRGCLLILEFG